MYRVLKDDKYLVIVIGTNNSQLQKISEYTGKVRLEAELVRLAEETGFNNKSKNNPANRRDKEYYQR